MRALQYLNRYLKKYRFLILLGLLFTVSSRVFAVVAPSLVGDSITAIEQFIRSGEANLTDIKILLLTNIALIIGAALISGLFTFSMRQTIINVSRHIEYDLKNNVYDHYQKLSLRFFKQNRVGDLMSRISEDVSRVRMYVGPALMYSINTVTLFIIVISYMVSVAPKLTLYTLLPLPILSFLIYRLSRAIHERSTLVQQMLSKLSAFSQESFSGINVIKSYAIERNRTSGMVSISKESRNKNMSLVKVQAWFFPLMILLIGISNVLVIFIGGNQYINGQIELGVLAEFIIYVNMLTWPVASVGWVTSLIQRAEASMERINEFLDTKCNIKNPTEKDTDISGNITFKDVSFIYPDTGIKALKNISFSVKENETLGIFGKTGSGKSTIANLMCRLYDTDNGSIFFGNTDIKELNLSQLRKNIGYVPQDGFLFSGTANQNISFGKDRYQQSEIINATNTAEITKEIENFPDKYDTIIGERGVQLSGGQRQRISIARAIFIKPPIYIFDDCLSAIDANKEQKILNNLKNITNNNTNIIISHRTSSIKNSNHIIVLDKGEITEEGTHDELIKNNGFYAGIHKKQTTENQ